MDTKILSLLGLAKKSGNLISGEDTCERLIKKNQASLVIIAQDASENTKKKFADMTTYRDIRCVVLANREELSAAIGKSNRTTYVIKDKGFADTIYKLIIDRDDFSNKPGGE